MRNVFQGSDLWIMWFHFALLNTWSRRAAIQNNEELVYAKMLGQSLYKLSLSTFYGFYGCMLVNKTWKIVFFMLSPRKIIHTVALWKQTYSYVFFSLKKTWIAVTKMGYLVFRKLTFFILWYSSTALLQIFL